MVELGALRFTTLVGVPGRRYSSRVDAGLRKEDLQSIPMQKATERIRILLAAGQAILREGLRHVLELEPDLEIAAETGDGREVFRLIAETGPDIAIVDLRLSGIPGLELLEGLSATDRNPRILVLATADDGMIAERAFELGAGGVVLKESAANVLIEGIRKVIEGKYWVGDRAVETPPKGRKEFPWLAEAEPRPRTYGLTKRELEIVAVVVAGYTNKEIARKLAISEDTVKHHVTNIFDKLGVYNRLELTLFAIHKGLVGRRQ